MKQEWSVNAVVIALRSEGDVFCLDAGDGLLLQVDRRTSGIEFDKLMPGAIVRCELARSPTRLIRAEVIAEAGSEDISRATTDGIVRVGPGQAAEFREMRLRALREHPAEYSDSYDDWARLSVDELSEELATSVDQVVFGQLAQSSLVGNIGLTRYSDEKRRHRGFLWGLYVLPEQRQHGIGRDLVAKALEYAATHLRLHAICAHVNARNDAALELLQWQGFVVLTREECALKVDGVLHDQMLLVRTMA